MVVWKAFFLVFLLFCRSLISMLDLDVFQWATKCSLQTRSLGRGSHSFLFCFSRFKRFIQIVLLCENLLILGNIYNLNGASQLQSLCNTFSCKWHEDSFHFWRYWVQLWQPTTAQFAGPIISLVSIDYLLSVQVSATHYTVCLHLFAISLLLTRSQFFLCAEFMMAA